MPMLPNGDVIPSHMESDYTSSFDTGGSLDNVRLRVGEVQAIVYADDPKSFSGRVTEYTVYVQERGNGTGVGREYYHCVVVNMFGGMADRCTYTLRAEKSASKQTDNGLGKGSKVLLLCINGEESNAVILGGIRDQKDATEEKTKGKDLKHHYLWVFNGLQMTVDDDGAVTWLFNGKTQNDGTLDSNADSSTVGTNFGIVKDGSFHVGTKSDEQFIKLDHKNKDVLITAKNALKIKHSQGVQIGQATDKMLMGSTFRQNQQAMHSTMQTLLQTLQALLTTAGAAITATIPGLSTCLPTGSAAATALTPAGVAITAAAAIAGQLRQSIQTFEQSAQQYLSQQNSLD